MMFLLVGKMNWKRRKKSYILLFLTMAFGVAALTIALLLVKSQKMLEADIVLQAYGNYDIAFSQATDEVQNKLEQDSRFSELGYLYDLGTVSFSDSGNTLELGALKDKKTEQMYYVNPVKGRYPEKSGEICIDRIALKSSGYTDEIGQKIKMLCASSDGTYQEEKEYTLVGIVEIQKQDEGVTYSSRYYPEEMFSASNMTQIDYPYAYISMEEAKTKYDCNTKHILTDVKEDENSADVFQSYYEDSEISGQLHVDTDHYFGREWVAQCILGIPLISGDSTANIVENAVETGDVKVDAYTRYFIPIFMVLIGLITAVGIFDSVRMSTEERRRNYGILLGLGMTGRRIAIHIIFEFFILLVLGVLCGWGIGILGYQGILILIKKTLEITLPSALKIDTYYLPYVNMVTKNPFTWSAGTVCFVCLAGISSAVVDLIHMSPLGMFDSFIHKKKHAKVCKGLYTTLNKYVGQESVINHVIPYITVAVVMSVSVFGFLFFHEKAVSDTSDMTERVKEASINGMDYYMKQTGRISSGASQYMHNSGVSSEMYEELEHNNLVKSIKGVMLEHSTALIYEKEDYISNILSLQSEYVEPMSDQIQERIAAAGSMKYFEYLGIDTEKQAVINVPSIAVNDSDVNQFTDKVIAGAIHPDKLANGEEVILAVTDEALVMNFSIGDSIPYYDFVRPEALDNSEEFLYGQLPEAYKNEKPTYSVTVDGETKDYWCYDTLKKINTKIGAIVYLDPATDDGFYFDDNNGNYSVNILTTTSAFSTWELPSKNYSRVGVTLKDVNSSAKFDSTWLALVQKAKYMDSIDVYSIIRQKEIKQRQVMAVFYAVIGVLMVISLLSVGNSLAMRIRHMSGEQKILQLLGMTKGRLLILYIRRFTKLAFAGAIISMLPAGIYAFLVKYAIRVTNKAYENNTFELLQIKRPWLYQIPKYNTANHLFIPTVVITFAITAVLITLLVLLQSKEIDNGLVDENQKVK